MQKGVQPGTNVVQIIELAIRMCLSFWFLVTVIRFTLVIFDYIVCSELLLSHLQAPQDEEL